MLGLAWPQLQSFVAFVGCSLAWLPRQMLEAFVSSMRRALAKAVASSRSCVFISMFGLCWLGGLVPMPKKPTVWSSWQCSHITSVRVAYNHLAPFVGGASCMGCSLAWLPLSPVAPWACAFWRVLLACLAACLLACLLQQAGSINVLQGLILTTSAPTESSCCNPLWPCLVKAVAPGV